VLIACLSDVHGNLPALESAIADARARGAERIVSAGDMTGYGPFPNGVCRLLRKFRIPAVVGNYDQKVIEVAKEGPSVAAGMKEKKRKILLWTAAHLDGQAIRFLSSLPRELRLSMEGHRLLILHGSPISMEDAIYPSITRQGLEAKLTGTRPDILVCGHTHIPFVKRIGKVLVVNCGSAGHPVDGDPRPAYALVRAERRQVPRGRIVRFAYDRDRTLATLEQTPLPKGLRKDFSLGTKARFLQ
jgi:putative phosphoesterase